MLSKAFYHLQMIKQNTTLINFTPGMVNTKMLISGFGAIGKPLENSNDTYDLIIDDQYLNDG